MEIKKLAATTAMAGALGFAAIGLGTGLAQADPKGPGPIPPVPGDDVWVPGDPPGHNPIGPPGQVKKDPFINGVPNPLYGVPPGHWDDPARLGLPDVWLPPVELLPPGYPVLEGPLPVVWNVEANAFGVWVDNELFVPIPQP